MASSSPLTIKVVFATWGRFMAFLLWVQASEKGMCFWRWITEDGNFIAKTYERTPSKYQDHLQTMQRPVW